jgi:hypothetical protein
MILAFGSRRSIGSVLALATSLAGTLVYRNDDSRPSRLPLRRTFRMPRHGDRCTSLGRWGTLIKFGLVAGGTPTRRKKRHGPAAGGSLAVAGGAR